MDTVSVDAFRCCARGIGDSTLTGVSRALQNASHNLLKESARILLSK